MICFDWGADKNNETEEMHKEAEKMFKDVGEAFGVLNDPRKRERYDTGADLDDEGGGGGFPGGSMNFSFCSTLFFSSLATDRLAFVCSGHERHLLDVCTARRWLPRALTWWRWWRRVAQTAWWWWWWLPWRLWRRWLPFLVATL